MNVDFDKRVSARRPEFNQDILNGIPYKQLRDPKAAVDSYIRTAERSFPDNVEFLGSTRVSPQEALRVMSDLTSRIDRKQLIDLAPSDVFMVKYQFRADGQDLIPRYMYLPNVKKGSRIMLAGKDFHISAVLTDPGFSVTGDYVFVRMTRAPVTFRRAIHTVLKDGAVFSTYLAHSKLHWKGGANDRSRTSDSIRVGSVVTTLSHYLFCKYGLIEAFRRFAKAEVKVCRMEDLTPELRDKYVVYASRQVKPMALKVQVDYSIIASDLCVLVPRDQVNAVAEDMAVSMFYIIDHFPEIDDPEEIYTDWQWKVWLGYVLWGDQLGHGKLVENVETHLRSLDDYVDVQTQRMLQDDEDIDVEDIYSLFAIIIDQINDLIANNEHKVASMYGKRLVTVPYVLKDIAERIFKCMFELTNNRRRKYTVNDYNQIFGKYFTVSTIMQLRHTGLKPFMSHVSSPGDNMAYRATNRLVMQARTGERLPGSSKKVNVADPANHLSASVMECGNYAVLPHAFPLGKGTLNPTALLDEKMTFIPKPHLKELIEYVETYIDR